MVVAMQHSAQEPIELAGTHQLAKVTMNLTLRSILYRENGKDVGVLYLPLEKLALDS